jgi:hypothetical protein
MITMLRRIKESSAGWLRETKQISVAGSAGQPLDVCEKKTSKELPMAIIKVRAKRLLE